MKASSAFRIACVAVFPLCVAAGASARGAAARIPTYDIKKSCANADAFSANFQNGSDYDSCIAEETNARRQLAKVWSSYTPSQRRQCLEPGPDKSYVETLTCLQMNPNAAGKSDIGGPIAPGLDFK